MMVCRRIVTVTRRISLALSSSSSFNTEFISHRRSSTIPFYYINFSQIKEVSDAVFLFDDMLRMRPRHSIRPFNQLLILVVDMEDYSLALHMFDKMRQCCVAYNEYTLNIVINCYCLLNRVDLGFSIFGMFLKSGLVPNVTTFSTLINGLVFDKGVDAVLLYKKLSRENLCEPDEVTLTTVIDCYCLINRLDLGFSVFGMFIKSGVVPNVITFSTLVKGLFLDHKGADAVLLFKKLWREKLCEPDELALTTLIECYCYMNHVDLGFSVLGIFFKYGLVPNVITFTTLIKGLFLDDKGADAVLLFKKLSRENLCEPDEFTFGTVIDGLCRIGNVHIAVCLLGILAKGSCKPNVQCYSPIIDSLCKDGMVDNALQLFSKMDAMGVTPNVVTYNSILQGLCDFSRWKEAKDLLDTMISRGVLLNSFTYSILIDAFCNKGNLKEAKSVLTVMMRRNVGTDIVTYSALIDGYCLLGEMEKARQTFDLISDFGLQPDVITYNTILHGFCQDGRLKEAMDMFAEMGKYGLQPDVITFNTIIGGFCQYGLVKEAKHMFVEMGKYGCTPNHITFYVIVKSCLRRNELQEAQPLFEQMKSKCLSLETANVYMLLDNCPENGGYGVPLYMIKKMFELN